LPSNAGIPREHEKLSAVHPRTTLDARLRLIAGVTAKPSRFSDVDSYWVGRTEIAHFHDDDALDVRLTHTEIRARLTTLRVDPRVELRPSKGADWLAVRFATLDDVEFAVGLVQVAAAANAATAGR
jgi:hypothetical protein